ncbi:MAG: SDR family NAD(P)-dependent oxidoreductase [Actinomycetota bacterium]
MRASFDGTGDVIAVTGGANGISRAVAEAAADAGAAVAVLDVAERPVDLPDAIAYHRVDVSERDALREAAAELNSELGPVTGLVCGAVIQPRSGVLEMDPEQWRRVQAVNLDGVVWTCQAFVPQMVDAGGGAVVVFTSGIATSGWPRASAYSTTKAAAQGLARSLAAEVADDRVRVNLISPGVVDTPQYRAANDEADRRHWADTIGVGEVEDVVGPVLFLLSDAATMTGSLLTRERAFRREP